MRPKNDLVYLGHMLDTARKIAAKSETLTRAVFDENEDLRFSLTYLVQIIGEAARCVSEETREQYPEIPWREVIGMRHKIVHDYMDISFDVLWVVVMNDIAPLLQELERAIPPCQED